VFVCVAYPSLTRSAECLTDRDLGQMRSDVLVAVRMLWEWQYAVNHGDVVVEDFHPNVDRWVGHEGYLVQYARALDAEWRRRRQPTGDDLWTVRRWLDHYRDYFRSQTQWQPPVWFGDEAFHADQRRQLRELDADAYTKISDVTVAGLFRHELSAMTAHNRR